MVVVGLWGEEGPDIFFVLCDVDEDVWGVAVGDTSGDGGFEGDAGGKYFSGHAADGALV